MARVQLRFSCLQVKAPHLMFFKKEIVNLELGVSIAMADSFLSIMALLATAKD